MSRFAKNGQQILNRLTCGGSHDRRSRRRRKIYGSHLKTKSSKWTSGYPMTMMRRMLSKRFKRPCREFPHRCGTGTPNRYWGICRFQCQNRHALLGAAKQYFQTLYQANQAVYIALQQAGITIPFPPRDIHMTTGKQGWCRLTDRKILADVVRWGARIKTKFDHKKNRNIKNKCANS